ncbi:hypothetical protein P7H16_24970 [Paenibacillus larvae]|nr:hypothetical protein [Paenibacillus larvae]MDT2249514.1 hypothetical protein [Paenibacillus larvae]
MAQYQINVDSPAFASTIFGKFGCGCSQAARGVLNQILQAQVSEQVEADRYERTENPKSVRMDVIHMGCIRELGNHYTKCSAHPWREVRRAL